MEEVLEWWIQSFNSLCLYSYCVSETGKYHISWQSRSSWITGPVCVCTCTQSVWHFIVVKSRRPCSLCVHVATCFFTIANPGTFNHPGRLQTGLSLETLGASSPEVGGTGYDLAPAWQARVGHQRLGARKKMDTRNSEDLEKLVGGGELGKDLGNPYKITNPSACKSCKSHPKSGNESQREFLLQQWLWRECALCEIGTKFRVCAARQRRPCFASSMPGKSRGGGAW